MTTSVPPRHKHETMTEPAAPGTGATTRPAVEQRGVRNSRVAALALSALRLSIGFTFLWAFIDKLFGLGYATPSAKAWIHGGSPTTGFLSHATDGPLQGFFSSLSGHGAIDWLFMAALLGIGVALMLGVALRPAAASGAVLLVMMWFATWPPAKMSGGDPTGSNNPFMDDHLIDAFALILIASLALSWATYLGRRWTALPLVQKHPWLR